MAHRVATQQQGAAVAMLADAGSGASAEAEATAGPAGQEQAGLSGWEVEEQMD